jgi:hypothetical protein
VPVSSQIVKYQLDDSTLVGFEVEPDASWQQAGAKEFVGQLRNAVGPAVEAAKVVLEKVKEINPEGVEVRFGVKVTAGQGVHPDVDAWVAAIHATQDDYAPLGSGIVIDDHRVLTCAHVVESLAREKPWVAFPKAVDDIPEARRLVERVVLPGRQFAEHSAATAESQ